MEDRRWPLEDLRIRTAGVVFGGSDWWGSVMAEGGSGRHGWLSVVQDGRDRWWPISMQMGDQDGRG